LARVRTAREQATLFDAGNGMTIDTGVLHRDDNLTVLKGLPSASVDLVYLDPPFFSNRFYEVIWGDEAEVRSFEDRWEGGMQHYIGWMKDRVSELYRILKPTGSFYLHCDPHASHYLKVMLDDLFGRRTSGTKSSGDGRALMARFGDSRQFTMSSSSTGNRNWRSGIQVSNRTCVVTSKNTLWKTDRGGGLTTTATF
jgi:hypothetical protein